MVEAVQTTGEEKMISKTSLGSGLILEQDNDYELRLTKDGIIVAKIYACKDGLFVNTE